MARRTAGVEMLLRQGDGELACAGPDFLSAHRCSQIPPGVSHVAVARREVFGAVAEGKLKSISWGASGPSLPSWCHKKT